MAEASNYMLIRSIIILFLISSTTPAADSITPDHPLLDGNNLSSTTGFFELGFFSPPGSTSRYVGIWYKNIPIQTVVWVANPEAPLINDSSGVLSLTADGNLSLSSGGGAALWSTGTSSLTDPILHLLDSGNLVLSDGSNTTKWQSFDYPSNTLLPGMEIGSDPSTNLDRRVRSWKSTSDPSPGEYSLGISVHAAPDIYIWNGSAPMSRYGPWDGGSWGGYDDLHGSRGNVIHNYISHGSGGFLSYDMVNKSVISPIVMDPSGVVRRLVWENQQWITFWVSQGTDSECGRYARCGGNGLCDSQYTQVCKCLPGFVPRSVNIWNPFATTEGCFRRAALASCRAVGDGFRNVTAVRVPELLSATNDDGIKSFDECRERCLSDCNCTAFTFFRGSSGCIWWSGDLVDVEQLPEGTGQEFYLRLAASELPSSSQPAATHTAGSRRHAHIILIVVLPIGLFVLGILLYFLWIRRYKRRGISQVSREQLKFKPGIDISITLGENEDREMKFLLFDSSTILSATNNFSEENKLGEGGFGPVYKGLLQDGQEIAVKRLSTCSGQGLEEFENEILLIAKLQHRNLVRLLGCCIQKEEMLIYEYMPNKSLDFYIFDSNRRAQLNWHMRFHIIEGIAQGLSYLHKYSRLRIIHRDLKASNILLDGDMNPKISDFGIARIFGSNATLEKTRRVVGTYGYMAPEYALEGLFSIKSDVFSFGVVLLEIISGKRNNYIYQEGNSQNLLGYAWTLWKGIRWFDLVDLSLDDTSDMSEIYKCIHVALMCVQENFEDRPTMSEVITMLSSENSSLPEPKQPAFFNLRFKTREGLLENVSESFSLNEVTITTIIGR